MRDPRPSRAERKSEFETLPPGQFDQKNVANSLGGASIGALIIALLSNFGIYLPAWSAVMITAGSGFVTGYLKRRKKAKVR